MDPNAIENTQLAATAGMMGIAYAVLGIISLICWIRVLIALFKKEGVGLGILGILCGIYAFVWGWIKAKELGLKKTMIWWTLSIVATFVVIGVGTALMGATLANSPEFQKAFEEAQGRATETLEESATTLENDTDSQ